MLTHLTFHKFCKDMRSIFSRSACLILFDYFDQQEMIQREPIFYDPWSIINTYREIPLDKITNTVKVIGVTSQGTAVICERD
jgi:hypothetical protein